MTTEIAILNKSAVALASDSAVTISGTDERGQPVFTKIYVDANKLFELVKGKPLGVMIYNSAEVAGVPWETLIKQFREDKPAISCDSLEHYLEELVAYVEQRLSEHHDPGDELAQLLRALSPLLSVIYDQIAEALQTEPHRTKRRAELVKLLDAFEAQLEVMPRRPWATDIDEEALWRQWGAQIVAVMPTNMPDVRFSEAANRRFGRLGLAALLRFDITPGNWSGLVIAGFGSRDLFPKVCHVRVAGVVANKLVLADQELDAISNARPAIIRPYAQTSEAIMFLQGIDPEVSNAVRDFWEEWSGDVADALEEIVKTESGVGAASLSTITSATQSYMQSSWQEFSEFMTTEFHAKRLEPIEASAGFLSKREIADLAENLVELTSLRNRVSLDREETVGGATDVAVISRGDGFVWVKRKHYFSAERNPAWATRQAITDVIRTLELGEGK